MVQPYEPRVDAEGEIGLIYSGGTFSHAMHKDPMIRRGAGPPSSLIDNQVVTPASADERRSSSVAGRALAAAEALLGPTSLRPGRPGGDVGRRGRRCSSSSCSTRCCRSRITPRGRWRWPGNLAGLVAPR